MSNQAANLLNLRKTVQQFRREAAIDRKKVSFVCKELINYCETNKKNDVLVHGFKSQKQNPFREETGCTFF
ncbi:guanine nucleotide-binding subunit gamma-1 [Brachionus plicatilis]|uniref:Guanine nucleotide-binding protein subunit gamma n=1 Tax=Brachionus plicatilis TaxID=10195 RepID=A0A3M7T377_BRAPC|nr:guanine nucleotide-binding subunit gamma-1 [Brachionus plicatilis]